LKKLAEKGVNIDVDMLKRAAQKI